jgi:hypothetical protein
VLKVFHTPLYFNLRVGTEGYKEGDFHHTPIGFYRARYAATRQKLAEEIQQTPSSAINHSLMYVELGLFYWVLEC